MPLLRAVAGAGRALWVVGDSRQSIYRFRGASSANMSGFSKGTGASVDQLAINYRSSAELVESLVAMAPKMGASTGMLPLAFDAERGLGGVKPQISSLREHPSDKYRDYHRRRSRLRHRGIPFS